MAEITLQQVVDQLNALTETVNGITDTSVNITDLDAQSPLVPTSEIPVSNAGADEKITAQQIIDEAQTGEVTTSHRIMVPFDFPLNNKTDLNSLHGGIHISTAGQSGIVLNSGQTITDTIGISKIMLVVNAGTDLAGDITITGTSVDRETAAETGADTDVIPITALTTDGSTTDSNGNIVHSFTGAYISSKWFKGAITLSTTDVDLTDIDVYQVAFEQFNDCPDIIIETLDATYTTTNNSAELDCYLYSVEVTDSVCDIELLATLTHETGQTTDFFRKRIGNIAKALDGSTDGIFIDLFLNPSAQTYFASFTSKVWASESETVSVSY
jgi:hypothetical protein